MLYIVKTLINCFTTGKNSAPNVPFWMEWNSNKYKRKAHKSKSEAHRAKQKINNKKCEKKYLSKKEGKKLFTFIVIEFLCCFVRTSQAPSVISSASHQSQLVAVCIHTRNFPHSLAFTFCFSVCCLVATCVGSSRHTRWLTNRD